MTPSSPLISVVIVTWHSFACVKKALLSLKEHLKDVTFEVIIVDNDSLSAIELQELKESPLTKIIVNNENLGFSIASNRGVQEASSPLVLLLNPDCLVTGTSIQPMVYQLRKHPGIGMTGPLILDPKGDPVRACRRDKPGLMGLCMEYTLVSNFYFKARKLMGWDSWKKEYYRSGPIHRVQGSCMLVRREEFLKLGGFDPRIPLFLDDMDLCARYEKSGMTVYYCSDSEVIHAGGQSIKKMKNPTHSSLINLMAHDCYFLKHGKVPQFVGHHLIIFLVSIPLLLANLILCIPLFLTIGRRTVQYLEKHIWMLIYSLTGCFYPYLFPKTWPRCLFKVMKNSTPDNPQFEKDTDCTRDG